MAVIYLRRLQILTDNLECEIVFNKVDAMIISVEQVKVTNYATL